MSIMRSFFLLTLLTPYAYAYSLHSKFIGHDFYDSWKWETMDDPTHGRVNYVDQATAIAKNLTAATDTTFIMRTDYTNVVAPGSRGRDSIRISSLSSYDESVIVIDLAHMPHGCGSWPAFWTVSAQGPWPNGGEIDIIEGVHENSQNLASLHTSSNCMMAQDRKQDGTSVSTNCDSALNYNQGCGSMFNSPTSYGAPFNAAGGGYYIMERSPSQGVNVWFWARGDVSIPPEVLNGAAQDLCPTSSWGLPDASFPPDQCDHASHFDAHKMIFDLTFCGDWAGSSFAGAHCGASTCADFVDNNPQAYVDAYWEINAIRVYT